MEVKRPTVQTRSCKGQSSEGRKKIGSETATERTPTEYAEVRPGEGQDTGILRSGPSWATIVRHCLRTQRTKTKIKVLAELGKRVRARKCVVRLGSSI